MSFKSIIKSAIPDWMISTLHIVFCRVGILCSRLKYRTYGVRIDDPKQIPIIINNYNRVTYLKRLIASLEIRGYETIYIIDNASTYEPLLDYYKTCPYHVFRLERNLGYMALWKSDVYFRFKRSYYVYTDSDMEIDENCPEDFMQKFVDILKNYPMAQKAGFGIRTDDLPDHFSKKQEVILHESKFQEKEVEPDIFEAQIDTTFALYRPFCKGKADKYQKTYRAGGKYVIRHLPWYADSQAMTDEDIYYINSVTQSTHWSGKAR